MIKREDILGDFHVHTINSSDSFSTVFEDIQEANRIGIKYLGITDHFNCVSNTLDYNTEVEKLEDLERVSRVTPKIKVIGGLELNFGQYHKCLYRTNALKVRLGWIHSKAWRIDSHTIQDVQKLTQSYIEEQFINVVAHPERDIHILQRGLYGTGLSTDIKEYFEWLVEYSKLNNVLLEVNEYSIREDKGGAIKRLKYLLECAKENGNTIILGSDAHFCLEVGKFQYSIELLNKLDYPIELVLNCNEDSIKQFFHLE